MRDGGACPRRRVVSDVYLFVSTRGRLAFSLARWRRPRRVAGTRALPTVRAPRAPIDG